MTQKADHSVCVDAWMLRAGVSDLSSQQLVLALEEACGALWQRALVTLGEVTMGALFERVLSTAAEQFPFLASLEVHADGLRGDALRESARSLPQGPLLAAIRFVLLEFLTVVGNLTAEILSPALHAALSEVPADASQPLHDASASHPGHSASEGGES